MANYVVCGIYNPGTGYSDIYVDTATGDVILESDLIGRVYLNEMCVLDAIPVYETNALENICSYFDCDGVILSNRHLITLKGLKAEYRDYADNTKVEHVVEFDTDLEADVILGDI